MSSPDEELVPIGTFARAARLTVKALRHYHAEGVIEPAVVDPRSNYRYYTWSQLAQTLSVTTLRDVGVPLPVIRAHLRSGSSLRDVLRQQRARLEREMGRAAQALAIVDELDAGGEIPTYAVDEIELPELATWAVTTRVAVADLHAAAEDLITSLLDAAAERGWSTEPAVWGEYPATLDVTIPVTAHLPVAEADRRTAVEADRSARAGLAVRRDRIPSGRYARVVHEGPLVTLPLAYRSLLTSIRLTGHHPGGPVYERYLTEPETTPPVVTHTEVLHPLPRWAP